MCLIVYSNDHAPLTVRLIYSSSKLRTVQMMIFSLVAMIGLAKCCITSACLQWLCHSGERIVARGPLVNLYWNHEQHNCVLLPGAHLSSPMRIYTMFTGHILRDLKLLLANRNSYFNAQNVLA